MRTTALHPMLLFLGGMVLAPAAWPCEPMSSGYFTEPAHGKIGLPTNPVVYLRTIPPLQAETIVTAHLLGPEGEWVQPVASSGDVLSTAFAGLAEDAQYHLVFQIKPPLNGDEKEIASDFTTGQGRDLNPPLLTLPTFPVDSFSEVFFPPESCQAELGLTWRLVLNPPDVLDESEIAAVRLWRIEDNGVKTSLYHGFSAFNERVAVDTIYRESMRLFWEVKDQAGNEATSDVFVAAPTTPPESNDDLVQGGGGNEQGRITPEATGCGALSPFSPAPSPASWVGVLGLVLIFMGRKKKR